MIEVGIVEVGPRDGLQNEKAFLPTDSKLRLIARLVRAGLGRVEITSCVSPHTVPQMADHEEVIAKARPMPRDGFSVLVPNKKGMDTVVKHDAKNQVREVAVFTAASETFAQRNINCSIEQGMLRFTEVTAMARETGRRVRGYVSTAIACPYEGAMDPGKVEKVASQLLDLGCDEISLGDTIGVGTPSLVRKMVNQVKKSVPHQRLAIHLHDTRGNAIDNLAAAIECGIQVVDASIGGLGGCPFAPGAPGNLSTEKALRFLSKENLISGNIDLDEIFATGKWIKNKIRGL